MTDLMTASFVLFAITTLLGSIAVVRRSRKQVRIYFGIALISLLLVVVSMIALSLSDGG